ncbi:methyltransferase [mine drainage metagenome]|uniref:Methyltransferase n=1 Tax=mine drainage metagenome TaxID=410659 RepID=T1B2E6_9ZZZZ
MRAHLLSVGERMPGWLAQGFAEYQKRLAPWLPLQLREIRLSRGKALSPAQTRAAEAEALLAALPREAWIIALDGRGTPWSSEQLAERMAAWRMGGRDVYLLIGGAEGLDDTVLERAHARWSLGPLTLPHMLVRVLVAEQLYRAASLLAGHPYHRG